MSDRPSPTSTESNAVCSWQAGDHVNHLVSSIAVLASEIDEFSHPTHDKASLRRSRPCDAPSPGELKQPFIPQNVKGPKHRVLVHAEHGSNVLGQWKAFPWASLAFGDCPSYFGCDLIVKGHRVRAVNLDKKHGTSHSSSVPVGLPEQGTATLDDFRREPAEGVAKVLFKEARLRRRRKRFVLGGAV